MKRMVNRHLATVLQESNLSDQRQHVFLKGGGTGNYLAALSQKVDDALTNDSHVDIAASIYLRSITESAHQLGFYW